MFTGIVEHVGQILDLSPGSDGQSYTIQVRHGYETALAQGESIAVEGTCLTVVTSEQDGFFAQISPTTAEITTLALLQAGDRVNLERPLTLQSLLGGHWLQGHVDERGQVLDVLHQGDSRTILITTSRERRRLLVEKGSVAVNGVSLTVVDLTPEGFRVTLIPHTLSSTTLSLLRIGSPVNLEYDLIAKYVSRLAAPYGSPR